ncbi:hypothetical protein TNCV_1632821 [Trichonephila clavipes]|nr:hypothetical protein TNCV_1632821 [Trichonephila clavipes]
MTPELSSPLLTSTPMGGRLSPDIFNVHHPLSSRRVFSGTRLELMTCWSRVRYLTTRVPWLKMANRIKTRRRITPKSTSIIEAFSCSGDSHSVVHPVANCKDQCLHSLLAARKRGSYQSKESKRI